MNREKILKTGIWFAVSAALQVLVFNNIHGEVFTTPMVYILFLILYPVSEKKTGYMLWAFALGIIIDLFSQTGGLNAMASVFAAYTRNFWFSISFRTPISDADKITPKDYLHGRGLFYILLVTLFHQLFLFTFEIFSWAGIGQILRDTLTSTLITVFFEIIILSLTLPRKERKK